MKIKFIKAKNFLSIGEEAIEIDFTKLGNIINIRGINYDRKDGSSNGSGKCFGLNTTILMYDGTIKKVQNVKVDDLIMGDDSTPRKVLNLCRGKEMLYNIIPKKGESYVVNESHILTLKNSDKKSGRYSKSQFKKGDVYNISVKDYLNQSKSFKHLMRTYRTKINFSKKPVKIDPYFLGLWLGNGTSSEPDITNNDKIIIDLIYDEAKKRQLQVKKYKKNNTQCYTYSLTFPVENKIPGNEIKYYIKKETLTRSCKNSFRNDLKYYKLFNNKHVPYDYKSNSEEIRFQLLAGFLDADGSKSGPCGYDFCSKFKTLAEDMVYIARSLGLAAYIKETYKCATNTKERKKIKYYRVSISGNCEKIPVKLPYKKCLPRKIEKDPLIVGLKIEPIGIGDYYGFTIDGNNLFLLGDFTVVHNSSITEIIVYALYGKLLKKLSHKEAINNKTKKNLEVEMLFDDYRILRTRKPDGLRFWHGNEELTLGGMPTTQELINQTIGLTYEAFINIAIFGQHNRYSFLSCDAATKRQIVENLLSLEKYNLYCQKTKEKRKNLEFEISQGIKDYENLSSLVDGSEKRIYQIRQQQENWKTLRNQEIEQLKLRLENKKDELENINKSQDMKNYKKSQDELEIIKNNLITLDGQSKKLHLAIEEGREKFNKFQEQKHEVNLEVSTLQNQITTCKEELSSFNEKISKFKNLKEDTECPLCYGKVLKQNFQHVMLHHTNRIDNLNSQIKEKTNKITKKQEELIKINQIILKVREALNEANSKQEQVVNKINFLSNKEKEIKSSSESSIGIQEKLLKEQFDNILKIYEEKKQEVIFKDPYEEILNNLKLESKTYKDKEIRLKNEIKEKEGVLPYYDFWIKGFGDQGIRALVIDNAIPTLNTRINYWLQFLIDNQIRLTFDNGMNEKIERNPADGDLFVYNGLSGGELARIDLAISQAFANLMMITSGTCPSLIVLDEVAAHVDRPGIHSVYSMICELARDRQVIVITHDIDLLQMLECSNVLTVQLKDGTTILSY